jgi:uncharacterized OsmC-like protein
MIAAPGGGKGTQGKRPAAKFSVQHVSSGRRAEARADTGLAPFGLLLSGLGACTAITLRMYAERQGWPLAGIDVTLT